MNPKPVSQKNFAEKYFGWAGAAFLIGAYFANSFGFCSAENFYYQLANLIGAVLVVTFSLKIKAFPNVLINAVWLVGGLIAIIFILLRKPL